MKAQNRPDSFCDLVTMADITDRKLGVYKQTNTGILRLVFQTPKEIFPHKTDFAFFQTLGSNILNTFYDTQFTTSDLRTAKKPMPRKISTTRLSSFRKWRRNVLRSLENRNRQYQTWQLFHFPKSLYCMIPYNGNHDNFCFQNDGHYHYHTGDLPLVVNETKFRAISTII